MAESYWKRDKTMTKATRITLTDKKGAKTHWSAKRRDSKHWQFTDHQGYTRVNEGNWNELVRRMHSVADNYGLVCHAS